MNKWTKRLIPVGILGVGAAVMFFMSATPKANAVAEAPDPLANAPYVQTLLVTMQEAQPELVLYGQLMSQQQLDITAPQGSKVQQILVRNGDYVQAGEGLFVLSNEDLLLQQKQVAANVADIKARIAQQLANHKNNQAALKIEQELLSINQQSVNRLNKLSSQSLSSAQELENAQRNLQSQRLQVNNRQLQIANHEQTMMQLQASLEQAQTQLDLINQDVADLAVKAEFAGRINGIEINRFDEVKANQVLATLVDDQQLVVKSQVALPKVADANLQQAAPAHIELAGTQYKMPLVSANQLAKSGSVALEFALENAPQGLLLDRYVRITWPQNAQSGFMVPKSAVYSNDRIYSVNDNQLTRHDVTVLGYVDDMALVGANEDLSGAQVLVSRLQDAAPLKLVNLAE